MTKCLLNIHQTWVYYETKAGPLLTIPSRSMTKLAQIIYTKWGYDIVVFHEDENPLFPTCPFFSWCTSFSLAFPNYSSLRISHFAYNTIMVNTVRNEVVKVMFLQACVCPHGGGGCLPQCILGYPPPEQTPLREQTHPPPTREQTPPPRSRHPTPRETATAADGTHPTGMHSCFKELFLL